MPANRASLGVTDAYRRRMLEIRRKGEQMARQTWGDVDPEDLAGTFKVKPLANGVGTLQRTGVLLSQAYVQAFIKSEIGKDVLIPTPQGFSGNSFDDVKLRFALWRPVVLVKQLLEQGVDMPEAMRRGRDTLLRSVSLATDGAIRDSLQKLYGRQPEIVGWKRAVKGTCDICMGAADGSTLPPGTPLDIHPSCECVSEAVVKPSTRPPGDVMPSINSMVRQNPGLDSATFDAYRTTAYYDLNSYLRAADIADDPALDKLIAKMDGFFAKVPASKEAARAYRGLSEPIEDIFPELRGQDLVGKVVDELGFSSTAGSRTVADTFATQMAGSGDLLELTVRPGVRGVVTSGKVDAEALLERDLSYRITGVRVEKGKRIIEMDVFR